MMMDPRSLAKLADNRVFLSASSDEQMWDGRRDLSMRIFFPNANNKVQIVPAFSPIYAPQYPQDWEEHRLIAKTLELLYHHPNGLVRSYQAGTSIFLLDFRIVADLVEGKKTQNDVLRSLEKTAK